MSDPKQTDTPEAQEAKVLHAAKPGVIDKGEVVATSGGEAFSGHVSDIADGDD
jgi:hypothetical protein